MPQACDTQATVSSPPWCPDPVTPKIDMLLLKRCSVLRGIFYPERLVLEEILGWPQQSTGRRRELQSWEWVSFAFPSPKSLRICLLKTWLFLTCSFPVPQVVGKSAMSFLSASVPVLIGISSGLLGTCLSPGDLLCDSGMLSTAFSLLQFSLFKTHRGRSLPLSAAKTCLQKGFVCCSYRSTRDHMLPTQLAI